MTLIRGAILTGAFLAPDAVAQLRTPAGGWADPAPPPPPEPARPAIQTYNWPSDANDSETTFSIVRRDGTIRAAIATWVQDRVLQHTGPNRITELTALDNVDREATRRLNAQTGLNLGLRQVQPESGISSRVEQSARGGK